MNGHREGAIYWKKDLFYFGANIRHHNFTLLRHTRAPHHTVSTAVAAEMKVETPSLLVGFHLTRLSAQAKDMEVRQTSMSCIQQLAGHSSLAPPAHLL